MNNSSNQKQFVENQNVKSDDALDKMLAPKKISVHKISILGLIFLIFIVLVQAVEVNYIKQYTKVRAASLKNASTSALQSAQPKTDLPSQVGGC